MYYAFHRDEYLFADETLGAVLDFIRECRGHHGCEDVTVWFGGHVVAFCMSDGTVLRITGPS